MSENFYIVPSWEDIGLKELRVSTEKHIPRFNGRKSGVKVDGKPIEDMVFDSSAAANNAIQEFAPWLAP